MAFPLIGPSAATCSQFMLLNWFEDTGIPIARRECAVQSELNMPEKSESSLKVNVDDLDFEEGKNCFKPRMKTKQ